MSSRGTLVCPVPRDLPRLRIPFACSPKTTLWASPPDPTRTVLLGVTDHCSRRLAFRRSKLGMTGLRPSHTPASSSRSATPSLACQRSGPGGRRGSGLPRTCRVSRCPGFSRGTSPLPGGPWTSYGPTDQRDRKDRTATSATWTARSPSTGSTAIPASTTRSRTRSPRISWPGPSRCSPCASLADPAQASYHNHTARELALAVFSLTAVEGHPSVESPRGAAARAGLARLRQHPGADRAGRPRRRLPRVDRLHAHHLGAARHDGRGAADRDRRGPRRALVPLPQHGDHLPLQGAAGRERGPRRRRRVPAPRHARQRRARLRRPPLQGPVRGVAPAAAGVAPGGVGEPGARVPVERPGGGPARPATDDREELPRERLFRGIGHLVLRDGWGPDSTWIQLACGPYFAKHDHLDAAHLVVYRKGYLAIDSGRRLHRHREPPLPEPLPPDRRPQHGARLPAGRDASSGARTSGRRPTTAASAWTRRASGTACAASRTGAARATCGTVAGCRRWPPSPPTATPAPTRRAPTSRRSSSSSRASSSTCARRTSSSCSTASARRIRRTARRGSSTA